MRYILKKKALYIGVTIILMIIFLHPDKNGHRSYEYIERTDILNNLHYGVADNFSSNAIGDCEYRDVLFDETTFSPGIKDGDLVEGHRIKEGGEYAPLECKPKFSTAIIVPYRDRAEQLRGFLIYMHMFLRRQLIHYRIYIIEQMSIAIEKINCEGLWPPRDSNPLPLDYASNVLPITPDGLPPVVTLDFKVDSRPFNRAKLMNIGVVSAARAGFPCVVLHDVDLLPLRTANLYACTQGPRHLSSIIDKFRFVLPYFGLFGGVTSITTKQYKDINGMSNEYYGWGGEDDDLYARLEANGLKRCRFDPDISQYHMLSHRKQPRSNTQKTLDLLRKAKDRMKTDGLNSLHYTEVATVLHPLFTHIMVDL